MRRYFYKHGYDSKEVYQGQKRLLAFHILLFTSYFFVNIDPLHRPYLNFLLFMYFAVVYLVSLMDIFLECIKGTGFTKRLLIDVVYFIYSTAILEITRQNFPKG